MFFVLLFSYLCFEFAAFWLLKELFLSLTTTDGQTTDGRNDNPNGLCFVYVNFKNAIKHLVKL
jgi:hypothetical protein